MTSYDYRIYSAADLFSPLLFIYPDDINFVMFRGYDCYDIKWLEKIVSKIIKPAYENFDNGQKLIIKEDFKNLLRQNDLEKLFRGTIGHSLQGLDDVIMDGLMPEPPQLFPNPETEPDQLLWWYSTIWRYMFPKEDW